MPLIRGKSTGDDTKTRLTVCHKNLIMINTLCKAPTQFGRRLRSNQAKLALAKSGFLWGDMLNL